ncbi:thiamine ABC transporter substrate-binding protein [Ornithinimicrobium tianjinense]|uniref:Thiamine ABC transporter substrate-binding protein n=1 Tax=Ornithinimicrobium tianjinense TaxID=1195761 RepID=A0A917BXI7_9MICO|nr:thiamine ABC transporter substrate-binding protein [Ornithinimicrobium tianjinense]GGF58705.1 thiamine ABC transporter substrate-binding protein [Ornithinimicrobium tianjinense]
MRHTRVLALTATLTLTLSSCSLLGGDDADETSTSADTGATADDAATTSAGATVAPPADLGAVTLITHDSFTLPEELVSAFEEESGLELEVQTAGDAGELTNQLVLTQGSPVADVVFGIDNTFGSRAVSEGVLAAYTPADLPASAEEHLLEGGETMLTPVDFGDVCVNVDDVWFANNGIAAPQTLQDLTKPEYKDLFVTPGATTSSPGLAFLLATVGEFGPTEWQGYWEDLMANGAKVTSGWTDAYTVDFTAGGGDGDRPIVLSYASSPPFTIPEGGVQPTTRALLDTCFRQVEYAGVLEGAANPEGAQAVVDWLVSPEVQAAIPDNMYMYPVDSEVALPELWAQWAPLAEEPIVVHPGQIEAERENWLREWADVATG